MYEYISYTVSSMSELLAIYDAINAIRYSIPKATRAKKNIVNEKSRRRGRCRQRRRHIANINYWLLQMFYIHIQSSIHLSNVEKYTQLQIENSTLRTHGGPKNIRK